MQEKTKALATDFNVNAIGEAQNARANGSVHPRVAGCARRPIADESIFPGGRDAQVGGSHPTIGCCTPTPVPGAEIPREVSSS